MPEPVVTEFPSGCRVVSGGLEADNSAAAAGGSGGLARGSALSEGGMWLGISELPAGHASTLHHHDGQTTIVYLVRGEMTFLVERGDGGTDEFTARAGEITAIPGGLRHREENRGTGPCLCVVVRNADQPRVVNLE